MTSAHINKFIEILFDCLTLDPILLSSVGTHTSLLSMSLSYFCVGLLFFRLILVSFRCWCGAYISKKESAIMRLFLYRYVCVCAWIWPAYCYCYTACYYAYPCSHLSACNFLIFRILSNKNSSSKCMFCSAEFVIKKFCAHTKSWCAIKLTSFIVIWNLLWPINLYREPIN